MFTIERRYQKSQRNIKLIQLITLSLYAQTAMLVVHSFKTTLTIEQLIERIGKW
jgi:hypothetical protein